MSAHAALYLAEIQPEALWRGSRKCIFATAILLALLAIGIWAASYGLPGVVALVCAAWAVAALLWLARRTRGFAAAERVAGDAAALALAAGAVLAAACWCYSSPWGLYGAGTAVLLVPVQMLVKASRP